MRKKLITALLAAALLACNLSACGNNSTTEENVQAGRENIQISKENGKPEGITSLIEKNGLFNRYCSTEKGFYYLTEKQSELKDGSYAPHLMYMDYETCREVYLCSDSSCRHDTEKCSSVLTGAFSDGRIFIFGGHLYFLNRAADAGGSTVTDYLGDLDTLGIEAGQAKLYRMNLDGSERKLIYSFEAGAAVEDVVLGSEDSLYFVTKKLDSSESAAGNYITASERRLICFHPESGKAEAAASLDFGDGLTWEVIGGADERIILKALQYPNGMTEQECAELEVNSYKEVCKNSRLIYASLDISTGEKKELYSQPVGADFTSEAVAGGFLYAASDTSKDVVKINIGTGEKSVLCSLEHNYICGTLGSFLCFTRYDTTADHGCYLADMQTGKTVYCRLTNEALGWELGLMSVTGDRALVVYDYEYEALGDDAYEITRYQYGLISLDDLLNSVPDYTPINMIREGI